MKSLLKNFFSLGLVQGTNLLAPLLLTPYLVETLGVLNFGIISVAQSLAVFWNIFVDYGFGITAVRQIAQIEDKEKLLADIANKIIISKLILLFVAFIFYVILIYSIPKFREYSSLFLLSYTLVVGQALLPLWFYQASERVAETVKILVLSKIFGIISVFYIVSSFREALYVNFLIGFSNIISSLFLLSKMVKHNGLVLKPISKQAFINQIKQGKTIFFSNVGLSIYTNTTILLLSFFASHATVGMFSIAEKVIQLLRMLLSFLMQTVYARVCTLAEEGYDSVLSLFKKIYPVFWVSIFILCLLINFFSEEISGFFVKNEGQQVISDTASLLKIYAFLPFIVALNMPFYQSLLAYHQDKITSMILVGCSLCSLVLNILLIKCYGVHGAIITNYFIETAVTILLMYFTFHLMPQFYGSNRLHR